MFRPVSSLTHTLTLQHLENDAKTSCEVGETQERNSGIGVPVRLMSMCTNQHSESHAWLDANFVTRAFPTSHQEESSADKYMHNPDTAQLLHAGSGRLPQCPDLVCRTEIGARALEPERSD